MSKEVDAAALAMSHAAGAVNETGRLLAERGAREWRTAGAVRGTLDRCDDVLAAVGEWLVRAQRTCVVGRPVLGPAVFRARVGVEEGAWSIARVAQSLAAESVGVGDRPPGDGVEAFAEALEDFERRLVDGAAVLESRSAAVDLALRAAGTTVRTVALVVQAAALVLDGVAWPEQFPSLRSGADRLLAGGRALAVGDRGDTELAGQPWAQDRVVSLLRARLQAAEESLAARWHWTEAPMDEVQRLVSRTLALDVADGLWAIEAALGEMLAGDDVWPGEAARGWLEAVRMTVVRCAIVVALTAPSRSGADGVHGTIAGRESDSWLGMRDLGAAAVDGLARACGRVVPGLASSDRLLVLDELRLLLQAVAPLVVAMARCGAGPDGGRADAMLRMVGEHWLPDVAIVIQLQLVVDSGLVVTETLLPWWHRLRRRLQ